MTYRISAIIFKYVDCAVVDGVGTGTWIRAKFLDVKLARLLNNEGDLLRRNRLLRHLRLRDS